MIFLSLNLTPGHALVLSHRILNLVSLLPALTSAPSSTCHSADDSETQIWSVSPFPLIGFHCPRGGLWLCLCLSGPFHSWLWCAPQSSDPRDLGTPLANSGTYWDVFTWCVPLLASFKTYVTTSVKLFWPSFLSFGEVFTSYLEPHCHHSLLYSIN